MSTQVVELYVYDLSRGMATQLGPMLGLHDVEGVWHTAVIAFGREWFYGGGQGIEQCPPGTTMLGRPLKTLPLGQTQVSYSAYRDYLEAQGRDRFAAHKYNLLEHNCNTFSNEVAQFLTGNSIPHYIIDLPRRVMSSPAASMLAPIIQAATPTGQGLGEAEAATDTPTATSTAPTSYKHFPLKEPVLFQLRIAVEKALPKIQEVCQRHPSFDANLLAPLLSMLTESRPSLGQALWGVAKGVLTSWPQDDIFPFLDVLRWSCGQSEWSRDLAEDVFSVLYDHLLKPESTPTVLQLSLKTLCNFFAFDTQRRVIVSRREECVSRLNLLMEELDTPISSVIQNSLSSLLLNFAVTAAQATPRDQEAAFQLTSALATTGVATLRQANPMYRVLVAMGTLAFGDAETRDLALALEARQAVAAVARGQEDKMDEVLEEVTRLLKS